MLRVRHLVALAVGALAAGCEAPELIPRDPARTPEAKSAPSGESARLLARVDAMKDSVDGREKPMTMLVALGNLYYDNRRYPDAIDWYRQAIEAAGPDLEARRALLAGGASPAREAPAGCAPSVKPGSYVEAIEQARSLTDRGRLSDALACYHRALTPVVEAYSRRGGAWSLLDRPDAAIEHLESALEIHPDDPESLYLIGAVIFDDAGRKPGPEQIRRGRRAWRRFVAVAQDHPRVPQIRAALERIDEMVGDKSAPPPTRGARIELPPTALGLPPVLAEAERRLVGGDEEGALELYERFLAVATDYPAALAGKGRALIASGRGQQAETVLRRALQSERSGRTLAAMALWYARVAGDKPEAMRLYKEAAAADPVFADAAKLADRLAALQ